MAWTLREAGIEVETVVVEGHDVAKAVLWAVTGLSGSTRGDQPSADRELICRRRVGITRELASSRDHHRLPKPDANPRGGQIRFARHGAGP